MVELQNRPFFYAAISLLENNLTIVV